MNKTEALAKKVKECWDALPKSKVENIKYIGPRGGKNARYVEGWVHLGDQTLTKACNMAGIPAMFYWSGSATTPATSIPQCLVEEMLKRKTYTQRLRP